MTEPRHNPNKFLNQDFRAYDKALRQTLIAHSIVAVVGIIPAAACLALSHDQFVDTAGLIASGAIEGGNLLLLRTNLRRSRIKI